MNSSRTQWIAFFAVALSMGCAGEAGTDTAASAIAVQQQAGPRLPDEVRSLLGHLDDLTPAQLDHVYSVDHFVTVGPERRVHVSEHFTLRSWVRRPHRGMFMLPGTISKGNFYNIDVDGYRLQDDFAHRGFFAFTVDFEGSGESTYPANGLDVTHPYLVSSMRNVMTYARALRMIPRIDVLGESNGGGIAAELCDSESVRSCTMASMIYRQGTPFFNAFFLDPGFLGFLESQPNGYLDVGPMYYFNIAARSSADVTAWILANEPGRYAVAPLVVVRTLPFFDPSHARAPGLILQGTEDDIATQDDSDLLAADYGSAADGGGHATIVRITGGGHVPRVEPAAVSEPWKAAVFAFVDGDHE